MKKTITISVDVAVMVEAKQRLGNISFFCNEAMKEALQTKEPIARDLNDAKTQLAGKIAEIAEMRLIIEKLEKKAEQDKPIMVIE